jgi:urea transport system substrate-binding protein
MAISERPVIDAVQLAVEEINAQGGLLGRPVEVILADGESDETVFARQAEKLIREDRVCTLLGCWTSASRKAVVPVVERHNHLLFYPVQYEGVEQSPNVVYLGPVPNQQILPALRWLVGFEGRRRWFLVGSDYVFPVTANAVIRDEARARGVEVVGEAYLLLGSTDVADVVRKIAETKPDLVVNTINGDTNVAFFRELRRARITPEAIPTLSFSISEEELSALGSSATEGDYVAGNYFQSLDTPPNRELLRRFGQRYGDGRVVSSAMETAYAGVHLWAQAVQAAGRDDPRAIREAVRGLTYDAPQGTIRIDPATQHAVQTARVGRVDESGRVREVYLSPQPITPEPYPLSRGREEWVSFLDGLYKRWGGRWSNPGP